MLSTYDLCTEDRGLILILIATLPTLTRRATLTAFLLIIIAKLLIKALSVERPIRREIDPQEPSGAQQLCPVILLDRLNSTLLIVELHEPAARRSVTLVRVDPPDGVDHADLGELGKNVVVRYCHWQPAHKNGLAPGDALNFVLLGLLGCLDLHGTAEKLLAVEHHSLAGGVGGLELNERRPVEAAGGVVGDEVDLLHFPAGPKVLAEGFLVDLEGKVAEIYAAVAVALFAAAG